MKRILLGCLLALCMVAFSPSAYAAKTAKIDVLYMNHGPLMDTISKIKDVLSMYGDKVTVSWYDYDTSEGEKFMAKKGIKQHIPLVIWIDDSPVATLGDRKVQFVGFPTGSGPAFFQGKWTVDDLRAALDQTTAKK
ncbi:MAG: hypothetical protein CVU64_03820 [Deltaproteobacteria bacterium HGW-Deltaproteobacteria-21]|nr:MAG: hypothetical protein CVU64_03820 [Deltaproteobacteria bacterium HGW-Deltaproteobacteria-21]